MGDEPTTSFSRLQTLGIILFVFTAGIPGMEQAWNKGVFGLRLDLPTWLLISSVGGAIGGLLLAPRYRPIGAIAGAIAGPCGLLAVYYYVQGRNRVWNLELVALQGVASLPAFGLYWLATRFLSPLDEEAPPPDSP